MSQQIPMFKKPTDEGEDNTDTIEDYLEFLQRFKLLLSKRPDLITITLSNIFTMRIVGNKTHGDLAEIAISEFVNQYMYDYESKHVGKEMYRAKNHEEDIEVINEIKDVSFPISLKAYGVGPLQLSTDKNFLMFPRLEKEESTEITDSETIRKIFDSAAFAEFNSVNVLPLIYDEDEMLCNIMVFDFEKAKKNTRIIRNALV